MVEAYTHGHHASVVAQHAKRTAEGCAAFVLQRGLLRADATRLIDVGCGPGSITRGLGKYCREVVGVDSSEGVVEVARQTVAGCDNVSVRTGSAYALPFRDGEFDGAFAHQVLQHLSDPVQALREMRRVVRPGGFVAVRDADYASMLTYPVLPGIERWRHVYRATCVANGAQPDAGRYLRPWMRAAGFADAQLAVSFCAVQYATPQECREWGLSWKDRALKSDFAMHAVQHGLSTWAELECVSQAWQQFADEAETTGASFYYVNGECVASVV